METLCLDLDEFLMDVNPCFLVDISVGQGNFLKKVKYVLDTGSKHSYLSDKVLDVLNCHSAPMSKRDFIIKTFLGSARKSLCKIGVYKNFNK